MFPRAQTGADAWRCDVIVLFNLKVTFRNHCRWLVFSATAVWTALWSCRSYHNSDEQWLSNIFNFESFFFILLRAQQNFKSCFLLLWIFQFEFHPNSANNECCPVFSVLLFEIQWKFRWRGGRITSWNVFLHSLLLSSLGNLKLLRLCWQFWVPFGVVRTWLGFFNIANYFAHLQIIYI